MMRPVWKREQIEAGAVRVRPLGEGDVGPATGQLPPPPAPPAPESAFDETVTRQLRLLNALAAGLVAERARQLTELRPELLDLTLLVCRELLGREVATDPAIVEHTLGQALGALGGASTIVAHLHPDDARWLQSRTASGAGVTPPGVQFVADATLGRGECRLESDRGGIDATWETQLRLVREALNWETGEEPA